jgi:hypothetical protein
MLYIERNNLIALLKGANSIEELIDLFSDTDIDTGYQDFYDTEAVKLQISCASRIIVDVYKRDKTYAIIDEDILHKIINDGGKDVFDIYEDTKF